MATTKVKIHSLIKSISSLLAKNRINMENFVVKRGKGKLISKPYGPHSVLYLDQLSDMDDIWINSGVFNSYLRKTYGINSREYYNIVVYGDINFSPRCKCGNDKKFISLSRGYGSTCGNKECLRIRSSEITKEMHKDKNSNLSKSLKRYTSLESTKIKLSNITRSRNIRNWSDPRYRETMSELSKKSINSWESKIKSKYKSFLRLGKLSDKCIFYLGLTDDNCIKFGITGVNLDKGRCNRKWRLKLKSIHRVVISDRKTIAIIEMNVKFMLKSNSEYTEFENLHKIISFIRNFIH